MAIKDIMLLGLLLYIAKIETPINLNVFFFILLANVNNIIIMIFCCNLLKTKYFFLKCLQADFATFWSSSVSISGKNPNENIRDRPDINLTENYGRISD